MGCRWGFNPLFEDHEKKKLSDLLKVAQEELGWHQASILGGKIIFFSIYVIVID